MFDTATIQAEIQKKWDETHGKGFNIEEIDIDPMNIGELKNTNGRYEVGMNVFYEAFGTTEDIFGVITYEYDTANFPVNIEIRANPHDTDT